MSSCQNEDEEKILLDLLKNFKAKKEYEYLDLVFPLEKHHKGGYCLHFDIKEKHKSALLDYLYEKDFRPCI